MSGQTVRNHRDCPCHIPTVNAGPSSSGIQAGSHKLLYFVVFKTSSDDISDINSSDGSSTASDEPQEGDDLEGHERPTKRAQQQGKLPVCQYIQLATVIFLCDIYIELHVDA